MTGNIDQFIDSLLRDFNVKQRKVIDGRFGLKTGSRATLQKIGDELDITRERVRQIEAQVISRLRDKIRDQVGDTLNQSKSYLVKVGGVQRDDYFIGDLQHVLGITPKKIKHPAQKLRFLFLVAEKPFYFQEDDEMFSFWYADESSKSKFLNLVKKITKFLKTSDKQKALSETGYLAECKNCSSYHLLSIPKHLGVNVFGDFGLRDWPEIEPKTIRDKAYLVLRKCNKPLHFSNIAKHISHYELDEKPAHIQTVHNELIKDDRFVLVGRGMYALREYGFEPGTVREVIMKMLRKQGPLTSNAVVNLVNEQRILRENTILLSLQNRRHFKRLDDGRYHVREA